MLHDGLTETRRKPHPLHLLGDDLGVAAIQLNALEGKGPCGMRTRRKRAVLPAGKAEQHDEIVEFVVEAGPRSALDLDDLTHEPPDHVEQMHGGPREKTAGGARVGLPGWMLELAPVHLDVGRGGCEAFEDFLLGKLVHWREAAIMTDLIASPTRAGGIENLLGFV